MDTHKKPELECLTSAQADFYNEQGYLLLENHLDMSIVQGLRAEIARIEQTAYGLSPFLANDISVVSRDGVQVQGNH